MIAGAGLLALFCVQALAFSGADAALGLPALLLYVGGSALAFRGLRRSHPHPTLGLGNVVTQVRLTLLAVILSATLAPGAWGWLVVGLATVSLCLDGLDGWLARRARLTSGFGARFDVEVDSALALVLAVGAAASGTGPAWVALLGLPRYAFVAAGRVLPWLRGDLPERFSRKAVCVVQIATLVALQAPILPAWLAAAAGGCTALALLWSFGLDIRFLYQAAGTAAPRGR